jgi:hypothetical protein
MISGQVWEVSEAASQNATLAQLGLIPSGSPTVTFSTSQIKFDSRFGGNNGAFYTIQSFLNSQGTVTTFAAPQNGLALTDPLDGNRKGGTLFRFDGMANFKTGDVLTFTHDDGFEFYVGGNLIKSDGGPTAPTPTSVTYTGPSGLLSFTIVYGECCGAPAVLEVDLNRAPITGSATPEPASLTLVGIGLAGLVFYRRRKVA